MHEYQNDLIARGLARFYRGRLIPIMKGGDETEDIEPLFAAVPSLFNQAGEFVSYNFGELTDEALEALIGEYEASIAEILAAPADFVSAELPATELLELTREAKEVTLPALKTEAASRAVSTVEVSPEDTAALEAITALQTEDDPADPDAPDDPAEPDAGEPSSDASAIRQLADAIVESTRAATETVVASATPRRGALPRPTPEREMPAALPASEHTISLVAAGGAHDILPGTKFTSELELAQAMCERHRQFGMGGPGVVERYAIAKANWKGEYPTDRRLFGLDEVANFEAIRPVIDGNVIKREFAARRHEQDKDFSLVASGGLCAPVTPYYNLQYISSPVRPVMGGLPSFNADRGGLRYARPAALSAVTTGVGLITEEEDAAGGSSATKTCQVIPCPEFQETDVDIIYHCLQFGNLGARAFPELVAQWNNLVLAAHARLAESNLLTQIDAFSTQVTASALGLGASATLFSQILAAADGLRSRNRMDPEAVLRLMLPWWAVDLIISDVIRSQFERFDTDQARVIALLRSFNIEPSFYIDSANGRGQVFGTQSDGSLLPFPATVVWYLFPEGSFLYLDGGMLELGIVRDSVLNKTNDFQIFGETFENVAYVGVESLAVETTVCDSGTVALPHAVTCPIDYSG